MLKWKPFCGLLVVIVGLGTFLWPRPHQAEAHGPNKNDISKIDRPASDCRLARRMLDRLALADFVGTIDFVYHATEGNSRYESQVTQAGRLFIAPNGRVRLDVVINSGTVTCCVADGQVWMLFPPSPLVHATRFPFPLNQADDAMLGQLRTQTRQTLVWGNMLVHNLFADSGLRSVKSARRADGRLSIELGAAGSDDEIGPMEIDATFMKEFGGYYPTQITFKNTGNIMTLGDYAPTQNGRVMARQITQTLSVSGRQVTWLISDIQSRKSTDTEFIGQYFESPTARSEVRPHLIGRCFYAPDGSEIFRLW